MESSRIAFEWRSRCQFTLLNPGVLAVGLSLSVKWKMYKTILRYCEGVDKPVVKPEFPMSYDLSSDPHEDWNLFATRLDNAWMFGPVFRAIGEYGVTVKKYPNIKPGQDFEGYKH